MGRAINNYHYIFECLSVGCFLTCWQNHNYGNVMIFAIAVPVYHFINPGSHGERRLQYLVCVYVCYTWGKHSSQSGHGLTNIFGKRGVPRKLYNLLNDYTFRLQNQAFLESGYCRPLGECAFAAADGPTSFSFFAQQLFASFAEELYPGVAQFERLRQSFPSIYMHARGSKYNS